MSGKALINEESGGQYGDDGIKRQDDCTIHASLCGFMETGHLNPLIVHKYVTALGYFGLILWHVAHQDPQAFRQRSPDNRFPPKTEPK